MFILKAESAESTCDVGKGKNLQLINGFSYFSHRTKCKPCWDATLKDFSQTDQPKYLF